MIECVHGYWLLLWYMARFSRYSHRNCIINYKWGCQVCRMECPDEYLGRLNFPSLQRGKTWEFSQRTACWIKMFFCVFSNCLSSRCIDFLASIYFYLCSVSSLIAEFVQMWQDLTNIYYPLTTLSLSVERFFLFYFIYIFISALFSFPSVI